LAPPPLEAYFRNLLAPLSIGTDSSRSDSSGDAALHINGLKRAHASADDSSRISINDDCRASRQRLEVERHIGNDYEVRPAVTDDNIGVEKRH
ncbi:hypothetical protein PFISCL1PPCAC_7672, partial [Pristionchus fissidentatus]